MTGLDPASGTDKPATAQASARHNLLLRIASAAVLAPLAVAVTYFGGWFFVLFWLAASVAVLWEWLTLTGARASRLLFPSATAVLAATAFIAGRERPIAAAFLVLLGILGVAVFAPAARRGWVMAGVGYAGALLLAPVMLREDAAFGFVAILFLFGVVWATDILGYFVGRAIGGPKLAPAISPGKTWAGALGGTVGAVVVACLVARLAGLDTNLAMLVVLAIGLSAIAQAGDLLESWIKRQFAVKDASHIIPGHGGVMDRLDGFWAAAIVAVVIGALHSGLDAPARGLLVW